MDIERRVLKSISEFSMFKYFLLFYLLFFILSIIVMLVIGLLTWLGLRTTGIDANSVLSSLGLGSFDALGFLGGGMAVTIIVMIVGGLFVSVIYAAFGTIMIWVMNVVLKMSGGIELRFLPESKKKLDATNVAE